MISYALQAFILRKKITPIKKQSDQSFEDAAAPILIVKKYNNEFCCGRSSTELSKRSESPFEDATPNEIVKFTNDSVVSI